MENPDEYEIDDEGSEITEEEYKRSKNILVNRILFSIKNQFMENLRKTLLNQHVQRILDFIIRKNFLFYC